MSSFKEAEQVRVSLKLNLSQYSWYNGSIVMPDNQGYHIIIHTSKLDNSVRKVISPVVNGVDIHTEVG